MTLVDGLVACHRAASSSMPEPISRPPIAAVVSQHVEEAAHLRHVRSVLVRAPHVKLHQLGRLDERIAAHLDGIAVAGDYGMQLCTRSLSSPATGEMFTLTVRAIERRDVALLLRIYRLIEAQPELERGAVSAFGWVSASLLKGLLGAFFAAPLPSMRRVALTTCAMHLVDPGPSLLDMLVDPDAQCRAAALRVAGACGRTDLLPELERLASQPEHAATSFPAQWAAVLLGARGRTLDPLLEAAAYAEKPRSDLAASLALRVADLALAQEHLRGWAARAAADGPEAVTAKRQLIRRSGIVGDPLVVPWLLRQMEDLRWSRLAGEAFTMITGTDLEMLDLERRPPKGAGDGRYGGPTERPEEDDVGLDEDDGLPWPDTAKVQQWWDRHQDRFAGGTRYFMGEPPGIAHLQKVLREGRQRQRAAAALWTCVQAPGTPLFPVAAPTRRQQRWLTSAQADRPVHIGPAR